MVDFHKRRHPASNDWYKSMTLMVRFGACEDRGLPLGVCLGDGEQVVGLSAASVLRMLI